MSYFLACSDQKLSLSRSETDQIREVYCKAWLRDPNKMPGPSEFHSDNLRAFYPLVGL